MKKEIDEKNRVFDEKYAGLLKRYFAHRGIHGEFPENSLPAFQEAIDKKFGIELDVHLTKDNELVVFHDDSLNRMTGEDNFVRFLTLSELKKLKLKGSHEKIPTLAETLNLVAGKTPILLEIKVENNTKKLCKKIIEELKNYTGEVFIQSFNPFALRFFYKHAPQYLRGQLSSFFVDDSINFIKKNVVKKLMLNKFAHIDFVSYNIKDLPNKYVEKLNVPILSWSIKTHEQFLKAKKTSDNLIVDDINSLNE